MNKENNSSENELGRLLALSNLDLDYYDSKQGIDWLAEMAATVAGTKISLVNLIDSYTQWTISKNGIDLSQMPREDSVCQFTLYHEEGEVLEINDLRDDDRFKDKFYVKENPNLTYYLGVPLVTKEGFNLGALCVMDVEEKEIDIEKRELLQMIARQIVDRLKVDKMVHQIKADMDSLQHDHKKLVHDIRGPISGIVGLAEIIKSQGTESEIQEVLEFMELIQNSGNSILELADEILTKNSEQNNQHTREPKDHEFNLLTLRSKILDMFAPQALIKKIKLSVSLEENHQTYPFKRHRLMQIIGNLISNSIKFTTEGGSVQVKLGLDLSKDFSVLNIQVKDSGLGMSQDKIEKLLTESGSSESGTKGEKGFGFGMSFVRKLVEEMRGTMAIESEIGEGTTTKVMLNIT
ncbi:GAF domain-containing sensor histidine kinase [Algoriphagus machipongonensis]|uniref:histidine kinase n=1 Tax=Algoriphagus machipongonensis TaxID=388413 RepID=A3I058_9BACT|nr:GAF domain-containing sensor histidine kinase [Algoriphagus machipongonensis]EAZ79854.1 putative histidine kinase response regulator hybrid protein [Algoriphagus machipongonensis]